MLLPFITFWILIFFGRNDLGVKGVGIAVAFWAALFAGFILTGFSPYIFVAVQGLIDVVLILIIFGGDIRIG